MGVRIGAAAPAGMGGLLFAALWLSTGPHMASRDDDPFALDDDPLDGLDFQQVDGRSSEGEAAERSRPQRTVMLLAIASVALAAAALVVGANRGAWATVAIGVIAYLLAVASDLRNRRIRRLWRSYRRPWPTALLRLAVFWVAVAAAWLAASGLASV